MLKFVALATKNDARDLSQNIDPLFVRKVNNFFSLRFVATLDLRFSEHEEFRQKPLSLIYGTEVANGSQTSHSRQKSRMFRGPLKLFGVIRDFLPR